VFNPDADSPHGSTIDTSYEGGSAPWGTSSLNATQKYRRATGAHVVTERQWNGEEPADRELKTSAKLLSLQPGARGAI